MHVFQILKNNVLIIDGDRTYSDTVDNFLLDAGAVSVPESVVYDDAQECCIVDREFLPYPNGTYSGSVSASRTCWMPRLNVPTYHRLNRRKRTRKQPSKPTMTARLRN